MKRWIIGAACTLGIGIVALIAVVAYGSIGRGLGVQFGSMGSPEAAFPVAVGFGSLFLIALSATVLVILVLVAIVRAYLPRTRGEQHTTNADS
jgi:uncharacterized membrane protein